MRDLLPRPKDFHRFIEKTRGIEVSDLLTIEDDRLSALVQCGFDEEEYNYLFTLKKLINYSHFLHSLNSMEAWVGLEFDNNNIVKGDGENESFVFMNGLYTWRTWNDSNHNGDRYNHDRGILEDLDACESIWKKFEEDLMKSVKKQAEIDLKEQMLREFVEKIVLELSEEEKE